MNRRHFLLLSSLSPVFAKEYMENNNGTFLSPTDMKILKDINSRLYRLRKFIGFANFNFISYDSALYFARNYSAIGKFTPQEKQFIEKLFYTDPAQFGFYGEKTVASLTTKINEKDLEKISYSGHYIFKGKPLDDYKRILKDVGNNIILTSGVRSVVKQLHLYSSKVLELHGDLQQASSIIAPPAYTYHAISDFDVGKKGWGNRNFTEEFAKTKEFAKMQKLNYITIRYTPNNKDGVRFEPWHVKVI